jgi:hypothetical protein
VDKSEKRERERERERKRASAKLLSVSGATTKVLTDGMCDVSEIDGER